MYQYCIGDNENSAQLRMLDAFKALEGQVYVGAAMHFFQLLTLWAIDERRTDEVISNHQYMSTVICNQGYITFSFANHSSYAFKKKPYCGFRVCADSPLAFFIMNNKMINRHWAYYQARYIIAD